MNTDGRIKKKKSMNLARKKLIRENVVRKKRTKNKIQ